jgi:hypothetical protein
MTLGGDMPNNNLQAEIGYKYNDRYFEIPAAAKL